jgi:DNA-binding LacI/PurR family transcriptional regulator
MSMRSIALAAGVSPMTVSLALRHSARISKAVRDKIHAIARAQGHVPNPRVSELMRELRQVNSSGPHGTLALIGLFNEAEPERRRGHLSIVIAGAKKRATEMGYSLERFWLRAPGMTPRRLRGILEARGINGIFCLGSEDPDEVFPPELDRFAIVTHGLTVTAPIHRVASHHHADANLLLNRLKQRGYRRPGLIIEPDWDLRTGHIYSAAFLFFQEKTEARITVPIQRMGAWNAAVMGGWLRTHRPDVIVINQPAAFYDKLEAFLAAEKIRVPRDLGIATLGVRTGPARYAGVGQDMELIGTCAIDMLMGRISQRDFGFSKQSKTEFVEGRWFGGRTIRAEKPLTAKRAVV